jgi:hypothetical protein
MMVFYQKKHSAPTFAQSNGSSFMPQSKMGTPLNPVPIFVKYMPIPFYNQGFLLFH